MNKKWSEAGKRRGLWCLCMQRVAADCLTPECSGACTLLSAEILICGNTGDGAPTPRLILLLMLVAVPSPS